MPSAERLTRRPTEEGEPEMSKKKRKQPQAAAKAQPPAKKGISPATWAIGAVAVFALVAAIVFASGGGTPSATGVTASVGSVPPEEAKYIGRLLPAAYAEPSVATAAPYTSTLQMSDVAVDQGKTQTSISVADVAAKKIVFFQYQRSGAEAVPMIAYVKPSGKLFVGVSFCIPCKSTGQSIEPDGTLRCKACGTKRDAETGVGVSGACRLYPLDELPVSVKGGKIVIENSAIDSWTPQPLDRKVGA
jgi:nitrite reductase/ring-hydroxylating ferredoxin subunit